MLFYFIPFYMTFLRHFKYFSHNNNYTEQMTCFSYFNLISIIKIDFMSSKNINTVVNNRIDSVD